MKSSTRLVFITFFISLFQWCNLFLFIALFPLISKFYFSIHNSWIGGLLCCVCLGVLFLPRLLGGLFFALRQKINNKKAYLYSTLLMAFASVGIAFSPTQYSIGIYAPFLMILLWFLQGFAFGGSWGFDFVLLTTECKEDHIGKRTLGFHLAPIMGLCFSFVLIALIQSTAAWGISNNAVTGLVVDHFNTEFGGWRICFVVSSVLFLWVFFFQREFKNSNKIETNELEGPIKRGITYKQAKKLFFILCPLGIGYAVALYTIQFFSTAFLEQACNLALRNAHAIFVWALVLSVPFFVLAAWWVDKTKYLKWTIIMGLTLSVLSYQFVFKTIQDRTAIKNKIELLDLKETQVKYALTPNTIDTLKKITSYHVYDDGVKAKIVRVDTLFAKHRRSLSKDKQPLIESEMSSLGFALIVALLLIPLFFFAVLSVAIGKFVSLLFHAKERPRALALFYGLSYSMVIILFQVMGTFYQKRTEQTFEQEATFLLKSLIFIGIVSVLWSAIIFYTKRKKTFADSLPPLS